MAMRKRTLILLVVAVGLLLPLSVAVLRLAGIPLTVNAVAARPAIPADGEWTAYTNGNEINGLAVEGDHVWAATQGGVVRWDRTDGSHVKYTTLDGLADNLVYAVAIDDAGHKWFGTYSGVSEYDGSTWTSYTIADGLAENTVLSVAIDNDGHKWFGTGSGGVSEYDGMGWTTYSTSDGLATNSVSAIAVDAQDHMWFGTNGGVSEFDGSNWTTYTTGSPGGGLGSNFVFCDF